MSSLKAFSSSSVTTTPRPTVKEENLKRAFVDQESFGFTYSQAGTSYAESASASSSHRVHRYGNPMEENEGSAKSVYSYRSSEDAHRFLERVDGRTFNVLSDTYPFPSDEDEWARLNKQHIALELGLSGCLYPSPDVFRAVLDPAYGGPKAILDVGCGTGIWTTGIAREFPHARVVGVDLAPCPLSEGSVPPNCSFEIDDINMGLSHFREQFDVVHCRLIASGIQNLKKTMQDVERCLKPGGLVIWIDVDYDMYRAKDIPRGGGQPHTMGGTAMPGNGEDQFEYQKIAWEGHDEADGSWFQRIAYEVRRQACLGGSDLINAAVAMDMGIWSRPLLDPETCRAASMYLPLGPWSACQNQAQSQLLDYTGALMRQSVRSVHKAAHPLFIKSGWPAEVVERWSRKVDEELDNSNTPLYARITVTWGRRRDFRPNSSNRTFTSSYKSHTKSNPSNSTTGSQGPLPAPPLPTRPFANYPYPPGMNYDSPAVPYPYFYLNRTFEEARTRRAWREDMKTYSPPPLHPDVLQLLTDIGMDASDL